MNEVYTDGIVTMSYDLCISESSALECSMCEARSVWSIPPNSTFHIASCSHPPATIEIYLGKTERPIIAHNSQWGIVGKGSSTVVHYQIQAASSMRHGHYVQN